MGTDHFFAQLKPGTSLFIACAKKWSVPILLLLLLGGCGFTLRGSAELPVELQTLQLESTDPNSDIVREVRRTLRNSNVTVVEEGSTDTFRLGIGTEESSELPLSVNANARAGEYELKIVVPFQLRRGAEVLGTETLSVARVYLADPENAVAKNEEAALIRTEMRRELAQQMLRRLQALKF